MFYVIMSNEGDTWFVGPFATEGLAVSWLNHQDCDGFVKPVQEIVDFGFDEHYLETEAIRPVLR